MPSLGLQQISTRSEPVGEWTETTGRAFTFDCGISGSRTSTLHE